MNKLLKSGKIVNSFIGFLAGALAVYAFLSTKYEKRYGFENNTLQVIDAYILPRYGFDKIEDFINVVELKLILKNLGNETIHLTSAQTEIVNSRVIRHKTKGLGEKHLSAEPEKNNSILIEPGESKEVFLAHGFHLPGMLEYLKSEKFKNSFYSNIGEMHMIHNYHLVDDLNKQVALLYGEKAGIKIQFFTNYKKLIKTHKIIFSDGSNMFGPPGKLQQEFFIGGTLSLLYGPKNY